MKEYATVDCLTMEVKHQFTINIKPAMISVSNLIKKEINSLHVEDINVIHFTVKQPVIKVHMVGQKSYQKLLSTINLLSCKIGDKNVHDELNQSMTKIRSIWEKYNPPPKWSVFYIFCMSAWVDVNERYDKERNEFLMGCRHYMYNALIQTLVQELSILILGNAYEHTNLVDSTVTCTKKGTVCQY